MTRLLLILLFCLPAIVGCGGGHVDDDLDERQPRVPVPTCGVDRELCK